MISVSSPSTYLGISNQPSTLLCCHCPQFLLVSASLPNVIRLIDYFQSLRHLRRWYLYSWHEENIYDSTNSFWRPCQRLPYNAIPPASPRYDNIYDESILLAGSWQIPGLYSYKTNPSSQTRTIALRTFIGSCATLVSSVVYALPLLGCSTTDWCGYRNLTMIVVLNGEPGWICLMCCNLDSTSPSSYSFRYWNHFFSPQTV